MLGIGNVDTKQVSIMSKFGVGGPAPDSWTYGIRFLPSGSDYLEYFCVCEPPEDGRQTGPKHVMWW
jgi:hypothetical protein